MFTADIVLGMLKKLIGFLWEYKLIILAFMIITVLYLRGNNYKKDYEAESVEHNNTVLRYEKQLTDIRIANERALRIAQEESTAKYKELVEKTQTIHEKYNERNKDINATITKLNSSNNSLQQTISEYTKRNSNTNESNLRNTTDATSLQVTGELLAECITRKQYYATEADKLNNSVLTLQEWGSLIIESNKDNSKGDKDAK